METDFNIDEGILKDVLITMKKKSRDMIEMERATVLCFDEIDLSNQVQIEKRKKRVLRPHKRLLSLIVYLKNENSPFSMLLIRI